MIFKDFFDNINNLSHKNALIFYDKKKIRSVTFSVLFRDIKKMVSYLTGMGVSSGDSVLLFIKPSYEFYLLIMAGFIIKSKTVIIDSFKNREYLNSMLEQSDPKYIFCDRITGKFRLFLKPLKKITVLSSTGYINKPEYNKEILFDGKKDALITFTSGITSKPKMIRRSIEDLIHQLKKVKENSGGIKKDTIVLIMLPVYVLASLAIGTTCVLFFDSIRKNKTRFENIVRESGVDAMIGSVSRYLEMDKNQRIKYVFTGGSIIYLNDARYIKSLFPNARIDYIYGASESVIISKTTLDEYIKNLENNLFCMGKQLEKVDIDFEMIDDKYGEFIIKTASKSIKTGDIGYIEKGYVYIAGRVNFSKITGGTHIYNYLIEQKIINEYNLDRVAFLNYKNKDYLFTEKCDLKTIRAIKLLYSFNVIRVFKIDRDYRHNYKVFYNKMIKRIKD